MRLSDWSSDVCSADLADRPASRRQSRTGGRRRQLPGLKAESFPPDQPGVDIRGRTLEFDPIMTVTLTLTLSVNGEPRRIASGATLAELVRQLELDPAKVAVERNLEVVPRSTYGDVILADGDQLEIVHFVGGGDHPSPAPDADSWTVAGKTFHSRLIVGTGKYKSFEQNAQALEASGAEMITVAVRRVNIADPKQPMLTDFISPKKYTYLPNTAGCFTGDEAIRTLRLEIGRAHV